MSAILAIVSFEYDVSGVGASFYLQCFSLLSNKIQFTCVFFKYLFSYKLNQLFVSYKDKENHRKGEQKL